MTFESWLALGVFATVVISIAGLKPLLDKFRKKEPKTPSVTAEDLGAIVSLHSQKLIKLVRDYPEMSNRKAYEYSCRSANAVLNDVRELQKKGLE